MQMRRFRIRTPSRAVVQTRKHRTLRRRHHCSISRHCRWERTGGEGEVGTGRKSTAKHRKKKVLMMLRIQTKGAGACACATQLPAPRFTHIIAMRTRSFGSIDVRDVAPNRCLFSMRAEKEKKQYQWFHANNTHVFTASSQPPPRSSQA